MLQQRILTALVLVALFLSGVLFVEPLVLAMIFAVVAAAGAWEWAPLAGWTGRAAQALFALIQLGLIAALGWHCEVQGDMPRALVQPIVGAACLFWSVATLLVESYPGSARVWRSALVRSLMGWLILCATWLSVVYLMSLENGSWLLVLLVLFVAVADVGAFFTGKSLGKHKLAPAVSPGKTWEGLWGGLLGGLLLTSLVWFNLPDDYAHLEWASLLVIGLACTAASVIGDLTVSMVKRGSGVKDSGSLLPGHGGLLDRLDSICGAAPVFALALMLVGY
ncbi:MAG: phosphatidate cytidylyltransferase [Halieaceae bacterium]|jgi:phosphatidate cytidylyltransferase|nr:phosphatidate cytidylyltransferase [Halieaceae bacterium]